MEAIFKLIFRLLSRSLRKVCTIIRTILLLLRAFGNVRGFGIRKAFYNSDTTNGCLRLFLKTFIRVDKGRLSGEISLPKGYALRMIRGVRERRVKEPHVRFLRGGASLVKSDVVEGTFPRPEVRTGDRRLPFRCDKDTRRSF